MKPLVFIIIVVHNDVDSKNTYVFNLFVFEITLMLRVYGVGGTETALDLGGRSLSTEFYNSFGALVWLVLFEICLIALMAWKTSSSHQKSMYQKTAFAPLCVSGVTLFTWTLHAFVITCLL